MATRLPTTTLAQVIEDIRTTLTGKPRQQGPAYTLIVGAGFSYGTVPLTRELLHECIGDFYVLNPDSLERTHKQRKTLSASYWKAFNAAGVLCNEPLVELDREGLPANPSTAYQRLFTYRSANALFERAIGPESEPRVLGGERFVKDFLRHVVDPGGYAPGGEGGGGSDYCTSGRNNLNGGHFFLASLLELQQTGRLWELRPFCRTIFTTNFDTQLQDALQLVNVLYSVTDRPVRGLEPSDFPEDDPVIHLVYTHGSILRHNAASTVDELATLTGKNASVLRSYLESRDVLVLGYGGWDDSLMSALSACDPTKHRIYWCDVFSADAARDRLAPAVLTLLEDCGGRAAYVSLDGEGADGFMARLYQALAPAEGIPALLRDPIQAFRKRIGRLKLEALIVTPHGNQPAPGALPLPRLEASAARIHGTTCRVLDEASRARRMSFSPPAGAGPVPDEPPARTSAQAEVHARLLVDEGFALAMAGQLDPAMKVWSRVFESGDGPSYESALAANYVGIVHARAGRPDLAIPAYTQALDLGDSSPGFRAEVLIHRGAAHHETADMEAALEDFSEAVAIRERDAHAVPAALAARALVYRGLTHQARGDARAAQQDFGHALELDAVPPDCAAFLASRPT